MTYDLKLELVVTRSHVPSASFDDALAKLREVEEFAAARGLVVHFAIAIGNQRPEKGEKQ